MSKNKEKQLELQEQLDALKNDNNFKSLKQKYDAPNGFTIMGNKRREEWHSNFMCWLLDPKQNHQLETFPLIKFFELIKSKNKEIEINESDIVDMTFETEHRTNNSGRIDIFGKSDSLVLVVENKIKAKETYKNGKPQSDVYYEYCEGKYKEKKRCYILLKSSSYISLNNENFVHITYQELFEGVIEPALERSKLQSLEDTERVLEQYILDISNPFTTNILAVTQKDIASKIYKKHYKIIEEIRETMKNVDRDSESNLCKFFDENKQYINKVILKSLKKDIIKIGTGEIKKLKGRELTNALLEGNYIIPDETELIYEFSNATCIIMVNEKRKFYAGYCKEKYDSSMNVPTIEGEFDTLREAQLELEKALGSQNSNGGKSAYKLRLIRSGVKEAEEKEIREILEGLR